ncbi:hypothetical protein KKC87_04610 [Patescibacteria group bacterium]|nr:hypothetical protein [Patescibacteria group bacterium]
MEDCLGGLIVTNQDKAIGLVKSILKHGPCYYHEIRAQTRLTPTVLHKAANSLGVIKKREGFGKDKRSLWSLPVKPRRVYISLASKRDKAKYLLGIAFQMGYLTEGQVYTLSVKHGIALRTFMQAANEMGATINNKLWFPKSAVDDGADDII